MEKCIHNGFSVNTVVSWHINYFIKRQLPLSGGTDFTKPHMQYTGMFYHVLNRSSYKIYVCMCVHEKFFYWDLKGLFTDFRRHTNVTTHSNSSVTVKTNTDFDRP